MTRIRAALRANGLSLVFGGLFLLALAGQAFAGRAVHNDERAADGEPPVGMLRYLTGSDFAVDVAENWQSEYLQFFLYVIATVWLVQRGSPESKGLDQPGTESDRDQKVGRYATEGSPRWARAAGLRRALLSNSLGLVMGGIFLLSWTAQSLAGRVVRNEELAAQGRDGLTWAQYVGSADFWDRTLQNWQSEFLAVGSMVVLSIYLRQRGSPESKPVGAAHSSTGLTG